MNERYQYNGPKGILDGVGSVEGPGEIYVDTSDPRVKRLIANETLVSVAAIEEEAAVPESPLYSQDALYAMHKAELSEIAAAADIDTKGLTKDQLVDAILEAQG